MSGFWAAISSIRFRLTAWYSLLLAVVLCAAGYGVLAVMQQSLRDDLDQRLLETARTIIADDSLEQYVPDDGDGSGRGYQPGNEGGGPSLKDFPGTVVQINSDDGTVIYSTFPFCQVPYDPPTDGATRNLSTHEGCGTELRVLTQAVGLEYEVSGGVAIRQPASLVVAQSLEPLDETMGALRTALALIGVLGVALAVFGGWVLAGRVLAPIDDVTQAAATIAESNRTGVSLATRLDVPPTGDEVARLSATFNRMLDRLQVAFDSRERFVANASHELRTPLAALRGNLDVLARQFQRLQANGHQTFDPLDEHFLEDVSEAVGDMQRESARMGRLLDDLLFLARADAASERDFGTAMAPIRLDDVVSAAVRVAENLMSGQKLSLQAEPVTIAGDADRITQLTLILLDNAIRHTPAGKEIRVTVGTEDGQAVMRVSDEGEGIAAEHLPHIFDRFYRVDTARSRASGGSGLGLSIAKVIAQAHRADISVQSEVGQGTTFTLRYPLAREDAKLSSTPAPTENEAERPANAATVKTAEG